MEKDKSPRTPRRRGYLLVALAFCFIGAILLVTYWMYPTWKSSKKFEEPKLTTVHIDDEPFARVPLGPGESYRPIEVMAGTEVDATCEVVSITRKPRFRFTAFDITKTSNDCVFRFPVPNQIGLTALLTFEYWDGNATDPTDVISVPVIVVGAGERMEFHAIEDEDGKPIQSVSVPDKVRIYGKAITHLPGSSKDYVALFFTADPIRQAPVLCLLPMKKGEKTAKPLIGSFVQYRHWGQELEGYAFWTPSPIILGGEDADRRVIDVYAGIFPLTAVPDVMAKSLEVTVTEDAVTLKPLLRDIESLRAMTVGGRLLSPPLHLVRGPGSAEVNRP